LEILASIAAILGSFGAVVVTGAGLFSHAATDKTRIATTGMTFLIFDPP
jgi:hypothetical protein